MELGQEESQEAVAALLFPAAAWLGDLCHPSASDSLAAGGKK